MADFSSPNLLDTLPEETDSGSDSSLSSSTPQPYMPDTTLPPTGVLPLPLPKRGGKHLFLGTYVGGCALDIDYKLKKSISYRSTFQVRTPKAIATAEKTLYDAKLNTTQVKFNGSLELPRDSVSAGKELDKVDFLRSLRTIIGRFGLETFFYLPLNGEMLFLVNDAHHFTIDDVILEHSQRMESTGEFKEYDDCERGDAYLSRLAVESLLSSALDAKILIRYGHYDDFDDLPGQIYLMMVLDICNASADHDIEAATITFGKLTLADFPGENIEDFATEALRLIKVMQSGYALPYTLGSDLLGKVSNTASPYFNRTVFTYLDSVRVMEDKVGASRDPAMMTKDKDYKSFGPVALCSLLQKEYAAITKRPGGWPARAAKIPQANHTEHKPTPSTTTTGTGTVPPIPPAPTDKVPVVSPYAHLAEGWRYKPPAHEDGTMKVGDTTLYFCRHCKCRKTFKVGLYNKTHSSSKHTGTKRGDMTKAEQDQSPPVDPNLVVPPPTGPSSAPAANLSPVITGNSAPESDGHVDTDPDGLEFSESAYFSEVLTEEDCGVWMAAAEDSVDVDFAPPAPPQILDIDPDSLSSASERQFGECMHCEAVGYAYTNCFDCDDIFYPADNVSSGIEEIPNPNDASDLSSCIKEIIETAPAPPQIIDIASDSLSGASERQYGECMHCNAVGYVYTKCFDCEDLFYPSDDDDSSGGIEFYPSDDDDSSGGIEEIPNPTWYQRQCEFCLQR